MHMWEAQSPICSGCNPVRAQALMRGPAFLCPSRQGRSANAFACTLAVTQVSLPLLKPDTLFSPAPAGTLLAAQKCQSL